MIINSKTRFAELMRIVSAVGSDGFDFGALSKPDYIKGIKVPNNLDELTLGQLARLQNMDSSEVFVVPMEIVLGIDDVNDISAMDVIGLSMWMSRQMVEIGKMFALIGSKSTPEEMRAGADKLNFGIFGMADSYAKRMGITNQDYVLNNVTWLRVWQCMKNDADIAAYQRRLRDIYTKKQ